MRPSKPQAAATAASMALQAPPMLPMGQGQGKTADALSANPSKNGLEGRRGLGRYPDKGQPIGGAFLGKLDAFLGILDMSQVDTTPGARCALAPTADLDLTPGDYRELMRLRYRTSPAHRQHMRIFARRIGYTPCVGPWAKEARKILEAIGP